MPPAAQGGEAPAEEVAPAKSGRDSEPILDEATEAAGAEPVPEGGVEPQDEPEATAREESPAGEAGDAPQGLGPASPAQPEVTATEDAGAGPSSAAADGERGMPRFERALVLPSGSELLRSGALQRAHEVLDALEADLRKDMGYLAMERQRSAQGWRELERVVDTGRRTEAVAREAREAARVAAAEIRAGAIQEATEVLTKADERLDAVVAREDAADAREALLAEREAALEKEAAALLAREEAVAAREAAVQEEARIRQEKRAQAFGVLAASMRSVLARLDAEGPEFSGDEGEAACLDYLTKSADQLAKALGQLDDLVNDECRELLSTAVTRIFSNLRHLHAQLDLGAVRKAPPRESSAALAAAVREDVAKFVDLFVRVSMP